MNIITLHIEHFHTCPSDVTYTTYKYVYVFTFTHVHEFLILNGQIYSYSCSHFNRAFQPFNKSNSFMCRTFLQGGFQSHLNNTLNDANIAHGVNTKGPHQQCQLDTMNVMLKVNVSNHANIADMASGYRWNEF